LRKKDESFLAANVYMMVVQNYGECLRRVLVGWGDESNMKKMQRNNYHVVLWPSSCDVAVTSRHSVTNFLEAETEDAPNLHKNNLLKSKA